MIALILTILMGDIGLSPDDLPAYKAALEAPAMNAPEVAFRDLWNRPDSYRGQVVKIRGTIARIFHGEPSGELPARVELWIATPSGDLICGVFPEKAKAALPTTEITFRGTSLGKITYASGDTPRIAPLIVGSTGPEVSTSPATSNHGLTLPEGILGIFIAIGVAGILIRNHLRHPPRRRLEADLPVEFLDAPSHEGRSDAI